jgi:periplasmic protein TonB
MFRVLLSLLAAGIALTGCSDAPDKPRRQQMVRLLPDTPPPPPPPVKPEDRPPPKPEDKPQPQDVPKPQETPQAQALKSDEAAGDGPGGGLTAGAVTQDYQGGPTGGALIGGTPVESAGSRLAANAFANAATRALNEFLVRDAAIKRLDYRVRVHLWLAADGSLQRAELVGSSGDVQTDEALRSVLSRFPGTGTPPPGTLPQPLRLQVSNRMLG